MGLFGGLSKLVSGMDMNRVQQGFGAARLLLNPEEDEDDTYGAAMRLGNTIRQQRQQPTNLLQGTPYGQGFQQPMQYRPSNLWGLF